MNYFQQKEGRRALEVPESSYIELKQELEDSKTEYYFNMRNKHLEYLDLKKDFNTQNCDFSLNNIIDETDTPDLKPAVNRQLGYRRGELVESHLSNDT